MASLKCVCITVSVLAIIIVSALVAYKYTGNSGIQDGCFRAAAYEHILLNTVDENLRVYARVVEEAAQDGARIVVFPENGLFSPPHVRSELKEYLETIPRAEDHVIPCEIYEKSDNSHTILYTMSRLAQRLEIYIVFDMGEVIPCTNETVPSCPPDEAFMYNTQVALDPQGYLIAKYHKGNLYGEQYYDQPEVEYVTFDTPFGKMGLFICFDLIFRNPAVPLVEQYGVDTMILSTHWFDKQPFLMAHQYQQSWSFSNQVNVIASNRKQMSAGTTGSGIYAGQRGAITFEHSFQARAPSVVMMANLPIDSRSNTECDANVNSIRFDHAVDSTEYHSKSVPIESFRSIKLNESSANITLCDNGMCCHLDYATQDWPDKMATYSLIMMNGSHIGSYRNWCEEACAVVAYDVTQKEYSSQATVIFSHLRLSANFSTVYVYPYVITNGYQIVSNRDCSAGFMNGTADYVLSYQGDNTVVNAGLYGRCYDRDG
ncbi:Pantetheinase [Halotydeus destructor]|nr:Pantetheinase [Halotydeus destructor]